jgi:hypothetical protein
MLTNADLRALYVLAADYHSGQRSRGYRFLSHLKRLMLKRNTYDLIEDMARDWDRIRATPEYAKWLPMAEAKF